MKRVLIILAVLVGLVAVMWIVGAMLPKQHVASRAAHYRQPPEKIWEAITNVDAMPAWRPGLKSIKRLADQNGKAAWVETGSFGEIPIAIEESAPPQRLVTRIADPKLPFGGTWTYELTLADGGCALRVTERGEIRPALFRFLARFFFGYTSTMEQYLQGLGKKFGEDVRPTE